MIDLLQFVILSLAVFRVVRLVIEDVILEPLRERTVYKLDPETSKLRDLLECPWCLSFWIGLAVVIAFVFVPDETVWACLPFALSAVVGLIANNSK